MTHHFFIVTHLNTLLIDLFVEYVVVGIISKCIFNFEKLTIKNLLILSLLSIW